jgi:hypothetical protein
MLRQRRGQNSTYEGVSASLTALAVHEIGRGGGNFRHSGALQRLYYADLARIRLVISTEIPLGGGLIATAISLGSASCRGLFSHF